eukprot:COSAG06_NODE_6179_length_3064_cov_2.385160_3_plen_107_part_00
MFVPSLSWQNDRFLNIEMAHKDAFSYELEAIANLPVVLYDNKASHVSCIFFLFGAEKDENKRLLKFHFLSSAAAPKRCRCTTSILPSLPMQVRLIASTLQFSFSEK